jgi:cell division protein FtsI/penicillin-binding protein 2
MRSYPALIRKVTVVCLLSAGAFGVALGAQPPHKAPPHKAPPPRKVATHKTVHHARVSRNYADPTKGDVTEFDDPIVRQVAVDALGHEKGSVVAVDPSSGRILAIVNQQMAFSSGFEPCSTIKPFIALAALQEGVITSDTMIRVKRGRYMNLTEAMAHSNNEFFQQVGTQLGFDQEIKYERLLGLGDRVGYNIPEEQPGALPKAPPVFGGVARMSSFGSGIRITPFQLASLASTLANGGTQYYLQYPRTETDRLNFESRVRGQLDIAPLLPDLREGMLAAVMYGTAKRSFDPDGEQDLGKTGTCNDENMGGRLGWFVSYADQAHPKIVIVVLLHGGSRVISGPHASQIAGRIYHTLYQRNYFVDSSSPSTNATSAAALQTDSSRESASLASGASR